MRIFFQAQNAETGRLQIAVEEKGGTEQSQSERRTQSDVKIQEEEKDRGCG